MTLPDMSFTEYTGGVNGKKGFLFTDKRKNHVKIQNINRALAEKKFDPDLIVAIMAW